jgi:hypothetical protein
LVAASSRRNPIIPIMCVISSMARIAITQVLLSAQTAAVVEKCC